MLDEKNNIKLFLVLNIIVFIVLVFSINYSYLKQNILTINLLLLVFFGWLIFISWLIKVCLDWLAFKYEKELEDERDW